MQQANLRSLIVAALFAALVAVATLLLPIPLPGSGYGNLGDALVVLAGCLLGPLWGALAAALGSFLADLLLGYALYAPASFVIKGIMAWAAALVFLAARKIAPTRLMPSIAAALVAEIFMVCGYFLFENIIFDSVVALAALWGNLLQVGVGAVAAVLLMLVLPDRLSSWFPK